MKRITFLLLSFLMAVLSPNPVSAQNNSTLTLSVSDTPLNEILNKIENKFNSLKTGIFSKYIEPHFKAVSLQLFCSGRTKAAVSTVCFV